MKRLILVIILGASLLSCGDRKAKDTVYYFKAETADSNPIAVRFGAVGGPVELILCPDSEKCYYWKTMHKNTWAYEGDMFELDVLPNSDTSTQKYTMSVSYNGHTTEKSFTLVSGTIKFN